MRKLIETVWTPVPCDVCGAELDQHEVLGVREGRIIQRQHDYTWKHEDVQCGHCGFVFNRLRPEPEYLRDYYMDCWPIASTSVAIAPDFDVQTRLDTLALWLPAQARIYEIGDKLGEFHSALTAAGYIVSGDDVMAGPQECMQWLDGLFRRGSVAVPPAQMAESFDAVLAYFVVEHLANPVDWLKSMRKLLMPSGMLIIEVPHLALHPKEALMHEHFLYLTPEFLTSLVNKAGYEVVKCQASVASRAFGFSLVARRIENSDSPDSSDFQTTASNLRFSYTLGRELQSREISSLATSAHIAAKAVETESGPVQISFFGSNQTASEIAAHLHRLLNGKLVTVIPYDNSDVKTGTFLEGFENPISKPGVASFSSGTLHIFIICSRGWTEAITEQIRDFGLPRTLLINGAAGEIILPD